MQNPISEYRDTTRTVYVPSGWSLKELSESASRLRSWAAIIGVPVAGKPVAQLSGASVRVHLPIAAEVMPHPDTGIRLGALASGTFNRAAEVPFAQVSSTARRLTPGATLEFYSMDGNFAAGDMFVERGALMPASLADYHDEDEAPAAAPSSRHSDDRRPGPFARLLAPFSRRSSGTASLSR